MTLTYARIANRVVADQYQAISTHIDALYNQPTSKGDHGGLPDLVRRLAAA